MAVTLATHRQVIGNRRKLNALTTRTADGARRSSSKGTMRNGSAPRDARNETDYWQSWANKSFLWPSISPLMEATLRRSRQGTRLIWQPENIHSFVRSFICSHFRSVHQADSCQRTAKGQYVCLHWTTVCVSYLPVEASMCWLQFTEKGTFWTVF